MRTELTQELVDILQPRNSRYDATDIGNPGFGVRIYPSGVKTYFYRYRIKDSVRFMRLGRASWLRLASAKDMYQRARDKRLQGFDPQGFLSHPVEQEAFYKLCEIGYDLNTTGALPEKLGVEPTIEEFAFHYNMSLSAVRKLAVQEYLLLLEREGRTVVVPLVSNILRDV